MEFVACLVFIGLMLMCSPIEHVKTAASIFWLVILFIAFITSPTEPSTRKKEPKACPPQSSSTKV
jgi:hypothetical protein